MLKLFKKKTRQELLDRKSSDLLNDLVNNYDCNFTDLEHILILNELRRKFALHLVQKQNDLTSEITNNKLVINEIQSLIELIE